MHFDSFWADKLEGFYHPSLPVPLKGARLLHYSECLARELNIDDFPHNTGVLQACAGERILPGMKPLAQAYSGHQFGVWAGQLGDGRGMLLGEQSLADGRRVEWHLKGAGKTVYSRQGDGRAVLRSVIREFLASEALYHLGIPTTRALSIITSEEPIERESTERGAMLLRVAGSHVRFGHFEHYYHQRAPEKVKQLADYVIEQLWPELATEAEQYRLWFTDVVRRTARLIACWQSTGFCHGVMNTDNMSILGITLDYGPYAFIDGYQSDFSANHSDYHGRYRFDRQPQIALWNLHCLAQALSGLIKDEQLHQALDEYEPELMRHWGVCMRAKLGFGESHQEDNQILTQLLALMHREQTDYTRLFRMLCETEQHQQQSILRDQFIDRSAFDDWYQIYRKRLQRETVDDVERRSRMRQHNPSLVLRTYLAQQAIMSAEQDDVSVLQRLHQALNTPFEDHDEIFVQLPPAWGRNLPLSCSS
ncbi:MAG: hypothetical protein XXXJIFNMEKO3_01603 [Candidatus Erwinia impunctatus]|nr:hypothetical protein XXXJIFNMEKO_01603 [Culicoides impunctatus]